MRLSKLAFLAALCGGAVISSGTSASTSWGQMPGQRSVGSGISQSGVSQVSHCDCGLSDCGCDAAMPALGCDGGCEGNCDGGCGLRDCGGNDWIDAGCGDLAACDTGCGGGLFDNGFLSDSELGDPYNLLGECCGFTMGGWVQLGYHNKNLSLFNSRRDELQLQQAWVYAEKELDTSNGFGVGGRVDYLYGTDGPDTQAFGIPNNHWDNQWDNGPDYGHAIPQAYLEAGYGDLSVKVGHFYTIIGYEVVAATGNFFYSHAYTMYNSEPFTHSGALFTYDMTEDMAFYGGYVLGWDSGFEDNGDAYIGGSSVQLTDDINVTSTFTVGRLNDKGGADERGYMSSTVASMQMTEKLSYIFQADLLDTENAAGETVRETFGINQYLIRSINDRIQIGSRFEWWNVQADSQGYYGPAAPAGLGAIAPGDFDIFALTLGMNVKPHSNVTIRPEIRWDWVDGGTDRLAVADMDILENDAERQTTFGVDTIFTY
ncbi:hypothetical protein K227x_13890 [Rubripirellula lacrimiformis]|uniref:Porin n=1 Tax=Rubripirellula lacrimiformis TaxID=1930273 RepID=A0A517N7C9_9BACT|nr:porin [Rubripirellula lacrimiformis]QDT03010.1 hypothetical protein K227x_13890 [Rubripirellula lacrimiformis]